MADYPIPKNAAAYILYTGLIDQSNTRLLKANPTIASGDFKVSIDGGAFANLATLPTVTPASGTAVKISLSGAEMTGDNIVVACIDAAGAEWCDQFINLQTSARGAADLAFPATSGRSMVVDASGLVDANVVKVGPTGSGTAQTAGDLKATLGTPAGASLAADLVEIEGETDGIAAIPTTTPLTAAQIATGVWQDTTAGDFTVALSIGKSVMNGVTLGTGLTINAYTGNTVQTGDAYGRIGAAGAGLTAVALTGTQTFNNTGTWTGNIVGTVSTLTTYTGNTPQTGDAFLRMGAAGASLTSVRLAVTGLDAITGDGGYTHLQFLQYIAAVLLGKISGAGTATEIYIGLDDSTTRVTVTADASGNRTAVTKA